MDLDHANNKTHHQNIPNTQPFDLDRDNDKNPEPGDLDRESDVDQDHPFHWPHNETGDLDQHLDLDRDNDKTTKPGDLDLFHCVDNYHNYPPESYAVCEMKVADWLDRNTFIERNPSVKFACSKNQDPCQTPVPRRSVTLNQKPKLSIIGFRKKRVEARSKQTDRVESVRLFRNRSEPGRDYCLLITEPVSPKVSCVGRVGSVRVVQGRKAGVWRSFKAVFSNLIQANRVGKIGA